MDLPTPTFRPPSPVPSADVSVRVARVADADGIGAVQARAWRTSYAGVLPAEALEALDPVALAQIWRGAIETPPSPAHSVLVALAGGEVVGFAAVMPVEVEPGEDRARVGELAALIVDPASQHLGHGSRLLNAAADRLRDTGFRRLQAWVLEGDSARATFLAAAGLAADGPRRALDLGGGDGELREERFAATLDRPDPHDHPDRPA